MSIFSKSKLAIAIVSLTAVPLLVACFDVENFDVAKASHPRLLIDDFEDGTPTPTSALFASWKCYPFNNELATLSCDIAPGYESNFAYALTFDVTSPSTPSNDGFGAGLGVVPPVGTVDLSSYETVHFSAKFAVGNPAPPPGTTFEVGMNCNKVQTGFIRGGFSVTHGFMPTEDWQSFVFARADFAQPKWQPLQMSVENRNRCPTLVDMLNFNVQVTLDPGQSAAGTLTIDNVWLE